MGSKFKTDRWLLNHTSDHLHKAYTYIYFVSAVKVENDRITADKDVVIELPIELDWRRRRRKNLN